MKIRDTQKQKVYMAETFLAHGELSTLGKKFKTAKQAEKYVSKLIQGKWFRKQWPWVRGVRVRPGHGGGPARGGLCLWDRGILDLKLPPWSRRTTIIIHELAHCVRQKPSAGHGREFCSAYLKLVQHYLGKEVAKRLREEFKKYGVKYRLPRRVTSPVSSIHSS
jgi:putative metallohydrolase (TIGR04338 family)